jgi:hypothetical protein
MHLIYLKLILPYPSLTSGLHSPSVIFNTLTAIYPCEVSDYFWLLRWTDLSFDSYQMVELFSYSYITSDCVHAICLTLIFFYLKASNYNEGQQDAL